MTFVVDASVTATWCFDDESDLASESVLDRLSADDAVVPAIWRYEILNILVVNERRGRIDPVGSAEFLAELDRLPILIDSQGDRTALLALARQHALSAYDAAYLELARRIDGPLATLDISLKTAAQANGITVIP